jgi:hypothetical protein
MKTKPILIKRLLIYFQFSINYYSKFTLIIILELVLDLKKILRVH